MCLDLILLCFVMIIQYAHYKTKHPESANAAGLINFDDIRERCIHFLQKSAASRCGKDILRANRKTVAVLFRVIDTIEDQITLRCLLAQLATLLCCKGAHETPKCHIDGLVDHWSQQLQRWSRAKEHFYDTPLEALPGKFPLQAVDSVEDSSHPPASDSNNTNEDRLANDLPFLRRSSRQLSLSSLEQPRDPPRLMRFTRYDKNSDATLNDKIISSLSKEETVQQYVYVLQHVAQDEYVKVGITRQHPSKRCDDINQRCRRNWKLAAYTKTPVQNAKRIEALLHIFYQSKGLRYQVEYCGCPTATIHREVIRASLPDVVASVEHWDAWMKEYEPYDNVTGDPRPEPFLHAFHGASDAAFYFRSAPDGTDWTKAAHGIEQRDTDVSGMSAKFLQSIKWPGCVYVVPGSGDNSSESAPNTSRPSSPPDVKVQSPTTPDLPLSPGSTSATSSTRRQSTPSRTSKKQAPPTPLTLPLQTPTPSSRRRSWAARTSQTRQTTLPFRRVFSSPATSWARDVTEPQPAPDADASSTEKDIDIMTDRRENRHTASDSPPLWADYFTSLKHTFTPSTGLQSADDFARAVDATATAAQTDAIQQCLTRRKEGVRAPGLAVVAATAVPIREGFSQVMA